MPHELAPGHQPGLDQQEVFTHESATASTQSADSQDNGWAENADWDFQDVPLDSPRSSGRHAGSSLARLQKAVVHNQASDAEAGGKTSAAQLAVLQQENGALKRRLKHVEAVSFDIMLVCRLH